MNVFMHEIFPIYGTYIHIYIYKHTHIYTQTHTHIHTERYACMHIHRYTNTHTHTGVHIPVREDDKRDKYAINDHTHPKYKHHNFP